MNGSATQTHPMGRFLPDTLASGSVTEGIGAISTIILAILGLCGIFSNIVAAVATIVIGGVFLADSLMARSAIAALNRQGVRSGFAGGVSAGFFGGLAGLVLGILSFFHPAADRLVPVAVLIYGAALFLSGGMLARLNWLLNNPPGTNEAMIATSSGSAFVGLAVTVLGILSVVGLVPFTLALVGLLCLGTGALFSGTPNEGGAMA